MFCIHLSFDVHLGCSHILAIMLQWPWGYTYLSMILISFSLRIVPKVGLLDYIILQSLIYCGISTLISTVVITVCIPTNSLKWFPFHHFLPAAAAAAAKLLQLWPNLCDPIDESPPGSPVPGILQARTLEWVAIAFSNSGKWKVKVKSLSRVRLFVTPWTVANQAPLSIGFPKQEYWSGVPFPSPVYQY